MKKETGKYFIKYPTGVEKMMGETETTEAIAMARREGSKYPDLLLVKITELGGCVVRWKPWTWVLAEWLRKEFLSISAFLYSKFRRLIAIGQALG